MQWGFEAEQMPDPRGDEAPNGKGWLVTPDDNVAELAARWAAIATRTEAVARNAQLTDRASSVVGSPAIRQRSAGSSPTCYKRMHATSGTWMSYAS